MVAMAANTNTTLRKEMVDMAAGVKKAKRSTKQDPRRFVAPLAILSKIVRILAQKFASGQLKSDPPPSSCSTEHPRTAPLGSQGAVLIIQSNQLELFCYL